MRIFPSDQTGVTKTKSEEKSKMLYCCHTRIGGEIFPMRTLKISSHFFFFWSPKSRSYYGFRYSLNIRYRRLSCVIYVFKLLLGALFGNVIISILSFYFQNDQVLQGFSVDKGEFTCPLCRQFANSVLPCFPSNSVERSHWHCHSYGSKSMRELIKEVEELQEQLGTFPVSISVRPKHLITFALSPHLLICQLPSLL